MSGSMAVGHGKAVNSPSRAEGNPHVIPTFRCSVSPIFFLWLPPTCGWTKTNPDKLNDHQSGIRNSNHTTHLTVINHLQFVSSDLFTTYLLWCPQDIKILVNITSICRRHLIDIGLMVDISIIPLIHHLRSMTWFFRIPVVLLIPTLLSVASAADTLQEKPWDLVTGEMVVIATQP